MAHPAPLQPQEPIPSSALPASHHRRRPSNTAESDPRPSSSGIRTSLSLFRPRSGERGDPYTNLPSPIIDTEHTNGSRPREHHQHKGSVREEEAKRWSAAHEREKEREKEGLLPSLPGLNLPTMGLISSIPGGAHLHSNPSPTPPPRPHHSKSTDTNHTLSTSSTTSSLTGGAASSTPPHSSLLRGTTLNLSRSAPASAGQASMESVANAGREDHHHHHHPAQQQQHQKEKGKGWGVLKGVFHVFGGGGEAGKKKPEGVRLEERESSGATPAAATAA